MRLVMTLSVLLFASSMAAADNDGYRFGGFPEKEKTIDTEAYIMGLSYHTNRDVRYNGVNPGFGLGITIRDSVADPLEFTISAGTYRDSYNETAKFCLIGPRYTFGNRQGLHSSLGISIGYYDGSGKDGIGIVPIVSIGYNRVDLFMTGDPRSAHGNTGSTDPKDNRNTTSGVVCAFLKIRLATF